MRNRTRKPFIWLIIMLCSAALLGLFFTPALADEAVDESGATTAYDVEMDEGSVILDDFEGADLLPEGEESFGSGSQSTWIPAADFSPSDSDVSFNRGPFGVGAKCRTGGASYWFDAGIRLPSGARLSIARIFYDDNSGTQRVMFWIFRNTQTENAAAFSFAQIFGPLQSPAGIGRWGNVGGNVNLTIANRYNTYTARFRSEGPTTCFFGVRLFWYRQVGPAGGQIFLDVPPSNFFFQQINNMYRSGITTGCPFPNYCPDANVTRAQMAAFFARALGLHWDYSSGY
jgi:hypothetical protein